MEKEIPKKKIKILGEDIEVYEWLTQDEEDKYNNIIMGTEDIDVSGDGVEGNNISIKVSAVKLSDARKFLVESLCASLTWDEYNVRSPKFREELFRKISDVRTGKKK
jgi:hypothetical protein